MENLTIEQKFPNLAVYRQMDLYQRWIEGANHPEDKSWREGLRPEEQAFLSFLDSGVSIVADVVAKGTFDRIRMAAQEGGDRLNQIFQDIDTQAGDSNDGKNADSTTPILMDGNKDRNGVVFGEEGHGKPVGDKLRIITLIQDYANSRLQAVQDGLESPYFAALLVDKYGKGIIDAACLFLDARKLCELVDHEVEKIDPDFRNHTAERYRSFADVSLSERLLANEENNEYQKLDDAPFVGMKLEGVVKQLQEYNKQGQKVCVEFNGYMLYSDTVTMDSAYLAVTGHSKEVFHKVPEDYLEKWEEKFSELPKPKQTLDSQVHSASSTASSISDKRVMSLFWWWSIDMANGCKGKSWRDTLTPEERALVETWDALNATKQQQTRAL